MPRLIKILTPIIAFGLLFYLVDFHALVAPFLNLSASSICLLLAISLVLIYISALKWGLFIKGLGEPVSILHLFRLYVIGYFINLILPSYVGGDAVRSWQIGKQVGQHTAAAATILERYTGLVAMVLLSFGCMFFTPAVTLQIKLIVVFIAAGIAAFTIITLSKTLLLRLQKIPVLEKSINHMMKIQEGLHVAVDKPRLVFHGLLLSFLYHSITVVNTLVCAYSVGWDTAPVGSLFVVLPLILLIGAVPIAPNGLGIQEGAFFYFLHSIGATPEQALGVALILRAKSYVIAGVGGLLWVGRKDDRPTNAPSGAKRAPPL